MVLVLSSRQVDIEKVRSSRVARVARRTGRPIRKYKTHIKVRAG